MAWADVPAKLEKYRDQDYGGDDQADKLIEAYGGRDPRTGVLDVNNVMENYRQGFEEELDYRIGACENLETSKAWKPKPGVYP
jgi:hypothetical protein